MTIKKNQVSKIFSSSRLPVLTAVYLINAQHNNRYNRFFHMHNSELEFYYVYGGEGNYMVANRIYHVKKGDLIICNAGVFHGDNPGFDNNIHSYCCALTNVEIEDLPDNWMIKREDNPIISCGDLAEEIGSVMKLLHKLSEDLDDMQEVCSAAALSLLLLIDKLIIKRNRDIQTEVKSKTEYSAEKIKAYLDESYKKLPSLKDIGEALDMHPDYISHVFKRYMGISPLKYAAYLRCGEAQTLLMDTELTISEIADLCRFAYPAYFCSFFKRYVGISPQQYRRSFAVKEE